ncbi:MAG: hypothetical protein A2386_06270 [Elusimicrobia bacterium RIFOXYB1_FULL_48_9]|nr:MAG: hypothetical protein A2386_06270 [Elusimicrobia bacterium RIFOXYB1_FULL_48_9]
MSSDSRLAACFKYFLAAAEAPRWRASAVSPLSLSRYEAVKNAAARPSRGKIFKIINQGFL